MPDLSRFAAFASGFGVTPPACNTCNTCNTVAPAQVLQESISDISAVAPVTPVTPGNSDAADESDLIDAYEERAAIMEFDGNMSREEAERLAWADIFGDRAKAA